MGDHHVRVILDGDRVVQVLPPEGTPGKSNWGVAVAAVVVFGLVCWFLWLVAGYSGAP